MSTPRSAPDAAIRAGVVLLTLIAAVIHLSLLFPDPAFILNGLGYVMLLAALYLPIAKNRRFAWRLDHFILTGGGPISLGPGQWTLSDPAPRASSLISRGWPMSPLSLIIHPGLFLASPASPETHQVRPQAEAPGGRPRGTG